MAKKPQTPKIKFNFYWLYGIIAVVLIGSMLFSKGGSSVDATVEDFYELAEKAVGKKEADAILDKHEVKRLN